MLFSASAGIIEIGSFALLNELLDWQQYVVYRHQIDTAVKHE